MTRQKSTKPTPPMQEGQQTRSLVTQAALMDAAETLVASKGMTQISLKEIVREAGQKNESALQYHFGNLQGLIRAIHARRHSEIQQRRADMLNALHAKSSTPSLRELCGMMVLPIFTLARTDAGFRRYIRAFSHEIALSPTSAYEKVGRSGGGGHSGQQTGELLRQALPHLDEALFRSRMELAVRMVSAALGHHARQRSAFRGKRAGLFVSNLIDALEGLLSTPISDETNCYR